MAREVTLRCDICKKPTLKIVGKLHFVPMIPGVSRGIHSNYTHHADVGVCCKDRLLRGFNFHKRMTAAQYAEKRRSRTA